MDSRLRLTTRDRPSFFFKKFGQHNAGNPSAVGAYDPNSDQLPSISHIDTASLVGLFERYNTYERSPEDDRTLDQLKQATISARDFAWSADSGVKSAPAFQQTFPSSTMATPVLSRGDSDMATVARNDSTGSSSLSSSSDTTPPLTRHSSSSSIMLSDSPLASEKSSKKPDELTALPLLNKSVPALTGPIQIDRQKRSKTWDPALSSAARPNLDKPLPLGPPESATAFQSTRPKHRRVESSNHPRLQSPTRFGSLRKHSRSTSVTFPLTADQPTAKPPTSPPQTSRGARLGKAMAQGRSPHQRSKSEDLFEGFEEPKKAAQRNSAPPKPAEKPSKKTVKPITARTAEHVIYRIMCQLENPQDLQFTSMVSKGFMNTYQRNESRLVSHLIFQNSRAAWELRRSIITLRGTRNFKLHDYQRDLRTIQALKALTLNWCRASCNPKTIAGLLGKDIQCQREVDNALWRIWTFCALFGDSAAQSPTPAAQIDWLNGSNGTRSRSLGAGFAVGNGTGLTVDELEDLSEMWCCLQSLVSQFHGREAEAQRVGIFDNLLVIDGDSTSQHIVEWTSYLLTLGPQVLLSLSSASFEHAKILGLTQWTLPPRGQSRNNFLMAAISHVYQERLLTEATSKAAQISLPSGPKHRPSTSLPTARRLSSPPVRQPSLRIDTTIQVPKRRPVSTPPVPATAHVMEIRPDCDPASSLPTSAHPQRLHTRSASASATSTLFPKRAPTLFPASPTTDPTIYHSLNLTAPANTASLKLGATLFPMEYSPVTPRVHSLASPLPPRRAPPPPPSRAPPPPPTAGPGVKDPIDKALELLVLELGFREANAKRALAMCDSGSGIDVERAIDLLMFESRREAMATAAPIELPTPSDIVSPLASSTSSRANTMRKSRSGRRDYCDGGCKGAAVSSSPSFTTVRSSITSHSHSRHRSAGHIPANLHSTDENEEAAADGNLSPVTDIYGGHSDDDLRNSTILDDDSSEIWRRREGSDTISPLVSSTANFRNVNRMTTQNKKAWKVLGVPQSPASSPSPGGGLKGGLARMRSKSSGSTTTVVPLEEYAARVERKKSIRMMQQAASVEKRTVSVGLGEQLKGLGLTTAPRDREAMSGGLGGFRVVEGFNSDGEGLKGKWSVRGAMGKRRSSAGVVRRDDGCMPSPCT